MHASLMFAVSEEKNAALVAAQKRTGKNMVAAASDRGNTVNGIVQKV